MREISESFLAVHPTRRAFVPVAIYAGIATLTSLVYWIEPSIKANLGANAAGVFAKGQWYRLLSGMLLHSDLRHLLSNLLFLIPFGGLLTFYYGRAMFPWTALVLGLLTHAIVLTTYAPGLYLNGSSGMLYAMFGLWLSLYYKAQTHLPRRKRWLRLIGFGLIMFVPNVVHPHVSYRAHYIGLALGLVCGWIYAKMHEEEFAARNLLHVQSIERNEDPERPIIH